VPPDGRRLALWTAALALPLAGLAGALRAGVDPTAALVLGLYAFGFVFAANSAAHSYLIVRYAESDAVAQRVGFYYASNAAGRLLGTLASGALYQWGGAGLDGLVATLLAATACVLVSAALAVLLGRAERGPAPGAP
jgi:hypothetical protein